MIKRNPDYGLLKKSKKAPLPPVNLQLFKEKMLINSPNSEKMLQELYRNEKKKKKSIKKARKRRPQSQGDQDNTGQTIAGIRKRRFKKMTNKPNLTLTENMNVKLDPDIKKAYKGKKGKKKLTKKQKEELKKINVRQSS